MTGQEFNAALATHHLSQGQFVRLTGANRKKVMEWADGVEDIPAWVPMFLAACGAPGGLDAAMAESDSRLLDQ
jgi:hypothetical protein